MLALHPMEQERVYNHIKSAIGDSEPVGSMLWLG